jgi:hypothetical protein
VQEQGRKDWVTRRHWWTDQLLMGSAKHTALMTMALAHIRSTYSLRGRYEELVVHPIPSVPGGQPVLASSPPKERKASGPRAV